MKDIFKPTIGNECLHKISNDNVVIVENFATSKIVEPKVQCSQEDTILHSHRCENLKSYNVPTLQHS
jgi:hypothetical protein